jgi:hypothetical protein
MINGLNESFVKVFSETDDLLTKIVNGKIPISLSLKELSKMHHLLQML